MQQTKADLDAKKLAQEKAELTSQLANFLAEKSAAEEHKRTLAKE